MKLKCWACPEKANAGGKEGKIQLFPAAAQQAGCPTASQRGYKPKWGWEERQQFKHSAMNDMSFRLRKTHTTEPGRLFLLTTGYHVSQLTLTYFLFISHRFAYVWFLIRHARGRKTQQSELALVSSPLLPALGLLLPLTQNNSVGLLRRLPNNPYGCQPHFREHQPHRRPRGWKEKQRSR